MMYCERCHLLSEGLCPRCRGALREPRVNDPVLLEKADPIRAAIIESVLTGADIPYSKMGRMGAALSMKTGGALEEYSFYVPYGAYERAGALTALPPPESEEEAEDEGILEGVDDQLLFEEEEEEEDRIYDEDDPDETYDREDPDMD